MKILVAGATGVIGKALLPLLVEQGHEVVGLAASDQGGEVVRALGGTPVTGDVFDRRRLLALLSDQAPTVVINELTDLRSGNWEANNRLRVEGTRNLVDAALASHVQRMVAQSYCLYAPGIGPAGEGEALDVRSATNASSAQALISLETTVKEMREAVILRYGTMYGPGTSYAHSGDTAEQVRARQLYVTDDVTSFMHVRDAARAAAFALAWPSGVFNIVDDEPATAAEWLPVYAGAIGAPPPPVDQSKAVGLRGASNDRARTQLGWEPVVASWRYGFRNGLR